MSRLILARHGESLWNKENVFTGWVDIPLSQKGVEEAMQLGKMIADMPIDIIFISALMRSQMTAMLAMNYHHSGKIPRILHPNQGKMGEWGGIFNEEMQAKTIPVIVAWQLNERMYGGLQGMNKDVARAQFGAEQVHQWRRSYADGPPERGELENDG